MSDVRMIPVVMKLPYSNGRLHQTLMSTDLSARVPLPKQTLSFNSSRGEHPQKSWVGLVIFRGCRAIFARQNDPRNIGKSLTDCLSGSVQVILALPSCFTNRTSQRWIFLWKTNISSRTPKMALHENPGAPGSWPVIFLHEAQKRQFFCT